MAFDGSNFVPSSAQANSNAPRTFSYATTDTLASAKGANYFDLASATSGGYGLQDNDVILVNAVDGVSFLSMAVTAGAATTAAANDFV